MYTLLRGPAAALGLLLLLLPNSTNAQSPSVFAAGSIVRIDAPGHTPGRIEGTVEAYTHEGLFVRNAADGAVYLVPERRNIQYLAHYRGVDRSFTARRYAMGGAFIGGAVGAIGGPLLAVAREDDDGMLRSSAVTSITGLLVGGAVGAILGTRRSTDSWKVYRLPAVRPTPDGGGVAVEVRIPSR